MRILILGAGAVGSSLAEHLTREDHNVVVVDSNERVLDSLSDRLDIQIVHGHGSHPDVLQRAGANEADVLIAVTNSDDVNMVACQVCYTVFQTPLKIARIRAASFAEPKDFFQSENMPIDFLISPEDYVCQQIQLILEHPGIQHMVDFADGDLKIVHATVSPGSKVVTGTVGDFNDRWINQGAKVLAIHRSDLSSVAAPETTINATDELFFVARKEVVTRALAEITHDTRSFSKLMIVGGGHIGRKLAARVENHMNTRVIESDPISAAQAAEQLESAVVVCADATDKNVLDQERLSGMDAYCAVTNNDEVNIVTSLLARANGVRRIVTLIANRAYLDLVDNNVLDTVVSPQLATSSAILSHIRQGNVTNVQGLRLGAVEAVELTVVGGSRENQVAGRTLGQLGLPSDVTAAAVMRPDGVIEIATDDSQLEEEDHVVLFFATRDNVESVCRQFQVKVSFI